jgi:DnaJ-domain-containing protein 1
VREAYLQLAKAYHPDRFAAAGLPSEVSDYLALRTRRINAAYALLEEQIKKGASNSQSCAAA